MIKEKPKGYNSDISNEVHWRLCQLSFICEKLLCYEKIVTREEPRKLERFFYEGIVFAETFYFFAWRIIQIAVGNKKIKPLPGLKGLKKKAKGVELVRNNLIVHPEGKKIFMISYSWGKEEGPRLKVARPAGQTFEISDRGLWINAQEFKNGFEKLLQEAIK